MSHVFISYSKKNKKYARKLADHLIESGFDVWIDDRIDYGSEWEEAIQQAIEICAAFVVIMTPQSRESKWVKRECQYAESLGKQQFPVLLSGNVFFRYGTTQYVDVTDGSLPPDAFLEELAEYAPRKHGVGENVTPPQAVEQAPVETEVEDTASPIPTGETHDSPPQMSPQSPPPQTDDTNPNLKAVPGTGKSTSRNRYPLVVGAGLLATMAILLLILNAAQGEQFFNVSTPAPTTQQPPSATQVAVVSTTVAPAINSTSRIVSGWFASLTRFPNIPTWTATASPTGACVYDWFFSDPPRFACPYSVETEVDSLVQWFENGVAIWYEPLFSFEQDSRVYLFARDQAFYGWASDWDGTTQNSLIPEQNCEIATHELFVNTREEMGLDFEHLGCPIGNAERGINYVQRSEECRFLNRVTYLTTPDWDCPGLGVRHVRYYFGSPQGSVISYIDDPTVENYFDYEGTWQTVR